MATEFKVGDRIKFKDEKLGTQLFGRITYVGPRGDYRIQSDTYMPPRVKDIEKVDK